jgi:two-component system CheB/CheR fusion protein
MAQGSVFIVRLRVVAAPPAPVAGLPSGRPPRPARRIMVVEDNRDQLQSLGMLLKLMGHEVLLVENGDDALRSAPGFAPELALIDIGLPGMNGYELARRIRDDPGLRDMTLVAQTGWGQDYDRMRSREAGFDHHLVKPLTTQELGRVLNQSRGSRSA